ncbi:MAG: divergent polysaccharide deacetylase family protein [Paracoccaceae bacterium]
MGRGFLSGLVWGSILSVMLVWMASQMSGMIEVLEAPKDIAIKAPEAVSVEPLEEAAAALPAAEDNPTDATSPQGAAPAGSDADAAPAVETEATRAPETSEVAQAPNEPAAGDAPNVTVTDDAPARSPDAGQAPAPAPTPAPADAAPRIAKAAPLPDFTQPVIVEPQAPAPPEAPTEPSPKIEAAPEAGATGSAPVAPTTDALPEAGAAPESPPAVDAEAVPVPDVAPEDVAPEVEPEPQPEILPEPETAEPETAEPTEPERAGTLEAAGGIGNLAPDVKVNRLPTIGGQTEAAVPGAEPAPVGAPAGPAITRFAATFENPENRPVMAILLIDEGGARSSVSDMEAFPFPVSYVVDAARPDASEAMADYRAAGREVVAMTPLPDGAAPKDVEVSFETYLARMPEVVAVMDTRDAAFQSGRQVAAQVAEILAANGMGMITYSKGLNAATQIAGRDGVPAKLVFREFDNDGQDGAAIQRFLDQAAFKAGQQTGVILVGHNRPETVAALLEWGLGNRAATVALAPVSAALLAE